MDLQKEREAFERHKFKDQYDELKDYYDEHERKHGYRYPPYTYDDEWEAWLAAKAQTIPDGYVLVQREPNREFKDRLRSYLDNLWMGDHGCDWDYFVDATAIKPNEIWRFMIEAQEPAND